MLDPSVLPAFDSNDFLQHARLLETETAVTGADSILKDLKTLQVDTRYTAESDGAFETKETDDGGLVSLPVIAICRRYSFDLSIPTATA